MPKILLVTFIFIFQQVFSINEETLKYFGKKEGLSQLEVTTIAQDCTGFIWVGTKYGLNRYDGYKFKQYFHNESDTSSLGDNVVQSIFVTHDNKLLIGTDRCLSIFDPKSAKFKNYPFKPKTPWAETYEMIAKVQPISEEEIFIGALQGGFILNKNSGHYYPIDKWGNDSVIMYRSGWHYAQESKNIFWTKMGHNIYRLQMSPRKVLNRFQEEVFHKDSAIFHDVLDIKNVNGTIYVGDRSGLWKYDKVLNTFSKVSTRRSDFIAPTRYADLLYLNSGAIYELNRGESDPFFLKTKLNPIYPTLSQIKNIMEDKGGGRWIGTYGGLFYYHPARNISSITDAKFSLKNDYLPLEDGKKFIVFDYNRIKKLEKSGKLLDDRKISINNIGTPKAFFKGKLYSLYHNQLHILDSASFRFEQSIPITNEPTLIHKQDNRLFICSYKSIYEIKDESLTKICDIKGHKMLRLNQLHFYNREAYVLDKYNALIKLDTSTGKVSKKYSTQNYPELDEQVYQAFHIDETGNLLFGTKSNGLFKLNEDESSFSKIPQIPNYIVHIHKKDDLYYIITNDGIVILDKNLNLSRLLNEGDGISTTNLNKGRYITVGNDLSFMVATQQKITTIGEINFEENPIPPQLSFTNLKFRSKNKEDIILDYYSDSILELEFWQNSFSVNVHAIHYAEPSENIIKYQLKGFNKRVRTENGSFVKLNYNNLDPGKYFLTIEGFNLDGVSSGEKTITVIVLKPFYQQWWFIILILTIVAIVGYLIYKTQVAKIRSQRLEGLVKERTKELILKNQEIEQQNEEIKSQSEELISVNENLEEQKRTITELYNEVIDSIKTAEVIQKSSLPLKKTWYELLPDSFVLYLPKDIVSGDFFWIKQKDNKTFIVAADCTGHGVAGGFMSMIGINLLERIIDNYTGENAAQILDKINEGVVNILKQREGAHKSRDGMDITIIIKEEQSPTIQYAGAQNYIYLVRKGELIKLVTDKFSIGVPRKNQALQQFINHSFELQEGDCIYMYSDGYADQLGGQDGQSKFFYPPFRKMLIDNYQKPMNQQYEIVKNAIESWKGETEQTDDILLIGFKV